MIFTGVGLAPCKVQLALAALALECRPATTGMLFLEL